MGELISKLGIDWKILIAQLINFGILAYILNRFLYKPIIKLLDDRRLQIEHNKSSALLVEKKLKEADEERKNMIAGARHESEKIIKKAESSAHKIKDDILAETMAEQGRITARAASELQEEKVRINAEIRRDIGRLIHKAVEKSVGDVLDRGARERLSKEALEVLKSDNQ